MNKFFEIKQKTEIIEYNRIFLLNFELIRKYFPNNIGRILAKILAYSPMGESKEKVFFSLRIRQRKGFLIRYIIRCANKYNIPKSYIDDFIKYKFSYDYFIKNCKNSNIYNNTDDYIKKQNEFESELEKKTLLLVLSILDNIKNSNTRKRKLDDILFSD